MSDPEVLELAAAVIGALTLFDELLDYCISLKKRMESQRTRILLYSQIHRGLEWFLSMEAVDLTNMASEASPGFFDF